MALATKKRAKKRKKVDRTAVAVTYWIRSMAADQRGYTDRANRLHVNEPENQEAHRKAVQENAKLEATEKILIRLIGILETPRLLKLHYQAAMSAKRADRA